MRRLIAGLILAGLAACASPPPTVYYPPASSPSAPPASSPQAAQGPFQPDYYLYACTPSFANRPNTDRTGRILNYDALIVANGIVLAAAQLNNA